MTFTTFSEVIRRGIRFVWHLQMEEVIIPEQEAVPVQTVPEQEKRIILQETQEVMGQAHVAEMRHRWMWQFVMRLY